MAIKPRLERERFHRLFGHPPMSPRAQAGPAASEAVKTGGGAGRLSRRPGRERSGDGGLDVSSGGGGGATPGGEVSGAASALNRSGSLRRRGCRWDAGRRVVVSPRPSSLFAGRAAEVFVGERPGGQKVALLSFSQGPSAALRPHLTVREKRKGAEEATARRRIFPATRGGAGSSGRPRHPSAAPFESA